MYIDRLRLVSIPEMINHQILERVMAATDQTESYYFSHDYGVMLSCLSCIVTDISIVIKRLHVLDTKDVNIS